MTVRAGERSLELEPWSYCYGSACVDAAPPDSPEDIGEADRVEVDYPLEGWSFLATFRPAGDLCGREQQVPLGADGDGTWVLEPAGLAGTYDVTLFGRGDGDLAVSFRWTTPADGPLAEPSAILAVFGGSDGEIYGAGVELSIDNVATTPAEASATVTVRGPDGDAVTLEPPLERTGCPEGSAFWRGSDDEGRRAAAELGDQEPFAYEVTLVLDGVTYTAEAAWPDDEIGGYEPYVPLDFDPPLPALSR